jgi:hypothetical protein
VAAALLIVHQLLLVVSGNYSWLNWLTIVLGASALSDSLLGMHTARALAARPVGFDFVVWVLVGATALLSIRPTLNLVSRRQAMNLNYNSLHLVNTYGAFGSVSRQRYEVVLEGTEDADPETARWLEYEHRGKPGPLGRLPPVVAPYHLRLDWMLWFLPFSVSVGAGAVAPFGYERWFLRLVRKLLEADRATLALLRRDPFAGRRPWYVRARYYRYQFTTWDEHRRTRAWWKRELLGDYLPPISAADRLVRGN